MQVDEELLLKNGKYISESLSEISTPDKSLVQIIDLPPPLSMTPIL